MFNMSKCITPENLTEKQKEILKSFRCSVSDVLQPDHDDYYLLRWLRARNFNEEKAEAMLRKSLTWRKQNRVNRFLEWYIAPEVFEKYHPGGLIGHDKEGCPVWMLNSGYMDVKGFVQSSTKSEFLRFQILRFETLIKDMKQQSKKLNKRIEKNIYIMDEDQLVVSQILNKPVLETLLNVFATFEANYPETLKRCYVINVPKLFFVLYSFIKPLLSEETANKVKIFGTEGWKEALLQEIDASVLPVHWGGTRVDPITNNPRCPSLINLGGPVPEKYFLENQKQLSEDPDVNKTIIQKRGQQDIKVLVQEAESIVKWEVETEENDLGIGFYYQKSDDDQDMEELIPCTRLETYRSVEWGNYECNKVGTYIVRLDNSFSWFSAKKVSYRITVLPPLKKMKLSTDRLHQ